MSKAKVNVTRLLSLCNQRGVKGISTAQPSIYSTECISILFPQHCSCRDRFLHKNSVSARDLRLAV